MAWIPSFQELARHPKMKKLARLLTVSKPTVIGHLHLLWWWALDYTDNGYLNKYEPEDVAEAMMWDGDARELLDALVAAGFVEKSEAGLQILDFNDCLSMAIKYREQNRQNSLVYRARKANAPQIENIDRGAIIERDQSICHICGQKVEEADLTLDHVIPLARGGSHTEDNLKVAHRSCNSRKGAR